MNGWPEPGLTDVAGEALGEALARAELRPGDEGLDVARLQRALVALSYLTDEQIQSGPGIYGPKTTAAVRAFQIEWGIPATGALCPETRRALPKALGGAMRPGGWDGRRPAIGTNELRTWAPVIAPTRGDPRARSPERYRLVIDQFAVEVNPRYANRGGSQSGHVFASDVARAMGVELPHWVDDAGNPSPVGKGRELLASELASWLEAHGARFGWREVTLPLAQKLADVGHPVIALAASAAGTRFGVVRPLEAAEGAPIVAAAGLTNAARARVEEALGSGARFFASDGGDLAQEPEPPPQPAARARGPVLKRGDCCEDVVWLQESLVAVGELSRADMATGPGRFGPRTESAVKALQQRSGLPTSGQVGPLTRAALDDALRQTTREPDWVPKVRLERGSGGREVWALQNALLRLGFFSWDEFVSSAGVFGPTTEQSVRALQLFSALPPSGIYGAKTRAALERLVAGAPLKPPPEEPPILGAERAIAFALNPPPSSAPKGGWRGEPMALIREAFRTRSLEKIRGPLALSTPAGCWEAFRGQGLLRQDLFAPRGAVVFFRSGEDGHAGISLGDGRYVGPCTRGATTDVRPIAVSTFVGWAAP